MNPYWIDASACRLAILPRPRGYDWLSDDIAAARRAGVDVIVSALTESERQELGLSEEAKCCTESAIEFLSFPIEDRSLLIRNAPWTHSLILLMKGWNTGKAWPSTVALVLGAPRCCAHVCSSGKAFRRSLPFRKFR